MSDPTYDKKEIEADPVWKLAFLISEWENQWAPIGWARFIPLAKAILKQFRAGAKDE